MSSNIDPKSNLFFWLALFGMVAPVVTFGVAISGLETQTKTVMLAAIAAAYTSAFVYAYSKSKAKRGLETVRSGVGVVDSFSDNENEPLAETITDPVTGLPNERAMMLVLEYQLAECQRERDERPLSVVALEIRDLAVLRKELGDDAASKILRFTADSIKSHLRSMDFLASIRREEFGLILPKADRKNASEVLSRIIAELRSKSFAVSDERNIEVGIEFGIASFWQDGETAEQLVRHAELEKQRAKAEYAVKTAEPADEYVH
jgi:diguanylate cyclase (GGDEF)-like protein